MRILVLTLILAAIPAFTTQAMAAPTPEQFVVKLYHDFAYREPTPDEVTYWAKQVLGLTPEDGEKRLRNWFFVHAAYKSTYDRTVTIFDVEHLVNLLDQGQLTYQGLQWSLFTSPEYKKAKAEGRAGKFFMKFTPGPL